MAFVQNASLVEIEAAAAESTVKSQILYGTHFCAFALSRASKQHAMNLACTKFYGRSICPNVPLVGGKLQFLLLSHFLFTFQRRKPKSFLFRHLIVLTQRSDDRKTTNFRKLRKQLAKSQKAFSDTFWSMAHPQLTLQASRKRAQLQTGCFSLCMLFNLQPYGVLDIDTFYIVQLMSMTSWQSAKAANAW